MNTKHPRLTLAIISALLVGSFALHAQTLLTASITEAPLPNAPSFVLQQASSDEDSSGVIQGIVTDVHGGLVPGASITLERIGHPNLRDATSDSAGHFTFPNVIAGTYTTLRPAVRRAPRAPHDRSRHRPHHHLR